MNIFQVIVVVMLDVVVEVVVVILVVEVGVTFSRHADIEAFLQPTKLTRITRKRSDFTFLVVAAAMIHTLRNASPEESLMRGGVRVCNSHLSMYDI